MLSRMARGETLIAGAAGLSLPRAKKSRNRSRHLRLLEWRPAMAHAGFEIFAKACLGRSGTGGLHAEDVDHLATRCAGFLPHSVVARHPGSVTFTQFEVAVLSPFSARTAKERVEPGLSPVALNVVSRLVVPPTRVSLMPSRENTE